MENQHT